MSKLTAETYQSAVNACAIAARLLAEHDLPGILEAIERAHSLGAMLDPTLYREKVQAMDQDKEILEAAGPLRRMGLKLKQMQEKHDAEQAAAQGERPL